MTVLDLSENNFTSGLPPWGTQQGMSQLKSLYLHGNMLAGSLPDEWDVRCSVKTCPAVCQRLVVQQDARKPSWHAPYVWV